MAIWNCWTQNPLGPRATLRTEEEARAWAEKNAPGDGHGWAMIQCTKRNGQRLPYMLYRAETGTWS